MRSTTIAALALVAVLALAGTGAAITNGTPDGNAHPEVGALLAPQAFSDGTWEECTGTLIAPRVFLTAAHCDEGLARSKVTFDSVYTAPGTTYTGTWHADPAFSKAQGDPHDLAVVVLDQDVPGHRAGTAAEARPARLAERTATRSRPSATARSR